MQEAYKIEARCWVSVGPSVYMFRIRKY